MATLIEQRYSELQSLLTTVASGDDLLAAKKFENAVSTYQVAGGQAVQLIAALNGAASQATNDQLQALQSHLASEATAQQAHALITQLTTNAQTAYNAAAIAAGQTSAPTPATAASAPSVSPVASGVSTILWIAAGVGVAALLYLTIADE